MMLISLVADGVHFEPLVKVVSARLLHYEASLFPFVISEYLRESFSETLQILPCFSPSFYSLVLAWL